MRTVLLSAFRRWTRRRLPITFASLPRAPLSGQRPADVRAATLRLVLDRLASADVPHSVTSSLVPTRTSVAVPAERRRDVARALAASAPPRHIRFLVPDADPLAIDRMRSSRPLSALTEQDLERHPVIRVVSFHGDGTDRELTYASEYGCDVELWAIDPRRDGWRLAPQPNAFASAVDRDQLDAVVTLRDGDAVPLARALAEHTLVDDITFPIDVVYLWVDGSDPAWSERMHRHRGTTPDVRADSERFRQMEELRYSLRSLDMYAPWVRRVFIVTDDQRPWFVTPDERLTIVDHREIADDLDRLPTYNSDVISSWMHRIPDLSEHFLFLNDDMFFGRDVQPGHFFTPAGQIKVFPSRFQRPLGPVIPRDDLPNAKAKNLSAAIEEHFGQRPVNIVRHTPYPMTRSLMQMVEQRLPGEIELTRSHRFREPTDVPIEQAVHYIGQITGDAIRSTIGYGYMNITTQRAIDELKRLVVARDKDVFCLNDAPEGENLAPDVDLIRGLLERMYPLPSRWEPRARPSGLPRRP